MDKNPEDEIVIAAMFKRLTDVRLPRAYDLEKRVNAGEMLNDFDVQFLATVFNDAQYVLKYSDKYPEYQEIVASIVQLYYDITEKALMNERNAKE